MNSSLPSIVTIDLSAIAHNFRKVKERVGPLVKVMAVVKSDGYGHGIVQVAKRLSSNFGAAPDEAADSFGVSFVHEGIVLRKAGLKEPIIVLGGALQGEEDAVPEYSLSPTVSSMEALQRLDSSGKKANRKIKVHIKVDTGMSRLGMSVPEALPALRECQRWKFIEVEGLCTHFAFAFLKDMEKNRQQWKLFDSLVREVKKEGFVIPTVHACNSAGIFAYPEAHYGMVRTGIALYGSSPFDYPFPGLDLKPAMRWTTRIVHIRNLEKGASVSYGGNFKVLVDSRIAALPVGYAQGLFRNLSGKIQVLVLGRRVRQVGTICMDFTSIDISGIDDCRVGDETILLGSENGEEITASEMAKNLGSIPYEIYCHVGRLAKRKYVK